MTLPNRGERLPSLDAETHSALGEAEQIAASMVPGLTVLCHPDPRRVGERAALPELGSGREVRLSRLQPLFSPPGEARRRPLEDPFLSRRPVVLSLDSQDLLGIDLGDSRTALQIDGESVVERWTGAASRLEEGVVLLLAERVTLLLHYLDPSPPMDLPSFGLLGESRVMLELRREIQRAAGVAGPFLVLGPTGSGKELVARALHDNGPRAGAPFLAVNLAAIPPSLASAELFGASRGAFTGSDRARSGYFQRAHTGTLFLDEVGEIAPEVQVQLLRVLETGELQPVGGEPRRAVDVCVIAATDADLSQAVATGRFRAALLHRLGGYSIRLPALAARRDDIGRLLVHFLHHELMAVSEPHRLAPTAFGERPWLPAPLLARLARLTWPGNVRQLRNVARQLVAGSRGRPTLDLSPSLAAQLGEAGDADEPEATRSRTDSPRRRSADQLSEEELLTALRRNRFRLQATATALGVARTSLYRRIERSPRIRKPRDLSRREIEAAWARCRGDLEALVDEVEVSRKGLSRRITELGLRLSPMADPGPSVLPRGPVAR